MSDKIQIRAFSATLPPARGLKRTIWDMRRAVPRVVAGLVLLAGTAQAQSPVLPLPRPTGAIPVPKEAFTDRPDRLNRTFVPGGVDDTEDVRVLVAPDGAPSAVTLTQRLVLSGSGQFVVYERSSAQDVEALEDSPPPVLKREAVVWQGFVDGRKDLVARLTLDPGVERELLPVGVEIAWRGAGRIGPGGSLPGPGEVVVRLVNRTGRDGSVPTGEVAPAALAGPLDTMLAYARRRDRSAPPMAGRGLPASLPAAAVDKRPFRTVAPMRVTGGITVSGANATGDGLGAKPAPGGLRLDGVLQGEAEFVLRVDGPGLLRLDLAAVPTLDPRLLAPPRGRTWAEWLRRGPTPNETRDAVAALVENAASAARDDEYAPYLGHHGPGKVSTVFRFALAPPEAVRAAERPLRPRPVPIALAVAALLAIAGNTTAIWRRL